MGSSYHGISFSALSLRIHARRSKTGAKNLEGVFLMTKQEIRKWCEENLFGERTVQGIYIPLSGHQRAICNIAVDIIVRWEAYKSTSTK